MHQMFASIAPSYGTPQEQQSIERIYPECRNISIDFGIMEKAGDVYVRCSDFGWSDVGTWGSLYQHSAKDADGNVAPAENMLYDTKGCIVKVPAGKLAVIEGLEDYIVVDSGDVLMICPKSANRTSRNSSTTSSSRSGTASSDPRREDVRLSDETPGKDAERRFRLRTELDDNSLHTRHGTIRTFPPAFPDFDRQPAHRPGFVVFRPARRAFRR